MGLYDEEGQSLRHDDLSYPPHWDDNSISEDDVKSLEPNAETIINEPIRNESKFVREILNRVVTKPVSKLRYIPTIDEKLKNGLTDGSMFKLGGIINAEKAKILAANFFKNGWYKRSVKSERYPDGIIEYVGTPVSVSRAELSSTQYFDKDELLDLTDVDIKNRFLLKSKLTMREQLVYKILFGDSDNGSFKGLVEDGPHNLKVENPVPRYPGVQFCKFLREIIFMAENFELINSEQCVMLVEPGSYLAMLETYDDSVRPYFLSNYDIDRYFGMPVLPMPMNMKCENDDTFSKYDAIITDLSCYNIGAVRTGNLDVDMNLDVNKVIAKLSGQYCGMPTRTASTLTILTNEANNEVGGGDPV